MNPLPLLAAAAACASLATAQVSTITVERVRECVSWLADDERAGRDTGSSQIVAAGEWIAARFAKAGLAQVQEGTWMHEFPLAGWRLDSRAVQLKLVCKMKVAGKDEKPATFVLAPDVEVRQATASDATSGEDEGCTVALVADPVLQKMLTANSARRPVVGEVEETDPLWLAAKGEHTVLGGRRQASRPLLLVKKGVLPPLPADASDVAWTATWSLGAPQQTELPQYNVMSVLRGTSKKDEYVLVSAHYDHLGTGRAVNGDTVFNGADDDASGTTAVILLAEALAKQPPPARSVLFVCFTGEEKGLLGSKAFAAHPPVPLEKIVADLNIEMIGRPEPGKRGKAWITGAELSDFAAIAAEALQRADIGVVEFPMARQLFMQSDNWPLAQKGVVAHSLSAGSLHEDYHQRTDEVSKLDIPHMTNVIRGMFELVLELANRDQPPQWNEKGKRFERPGR
jgi:hypothetical protein